MSKSETILEMLTRIPKGKVTTYGTLAKAAKSSPRAVGQVMRRNPHPEIYPCYKVIKSSGELGGYSGMEKGRMVKRKIKLLKSDGVVVKNNKIDKKYIFYFDK